MSGIQAGDVVELKSGGPAIIIAGRRRGTVGPMAESRFLMLSHAAGHLPQSSYRAGYTVGIDAAFYSRLGYEDLLKQIAAEGGDRSLGLADGLLRVL